MARRANQEENSSSGSGERRTGSSGVQTLGELMEKEVGLSGEPGCSGVCRDVEVAREGLRRFAQLLRIAEFGVARAFIAVEAGHATTTRRRNVFQSLDDFACDAFLA